MHYLIVHSVDLGGGDVDGIHCTAEAIGIDIVSDLKRLEQQQHHSARKVLQCTAQCHADSQAAGGQKSCERAGGHTQDAYNHDKQNHGQGYVDEAYRECRQGRFYFSLYEYLPEKFLYASDNPCAQQVQEYCRQDFQSPFDNAFRDG